MPQATSSIIQKPTIGIEHCNRCDTVELDSGRIFCAAATGVNGTALMEAVYEDTELKKAGLFANEWLRSDTVVSINDQIRVGSYHLSSEKNGGKLKLNTCGFNPQRQPKVFQFKRRVAPNRFWIHTEYCPRETRGKVNQKSPQEMALSKMNEVLNDAAKSFNKNTLWGIAGTQNAGGLNGSSGSIAQGSAMNGFITELWLAANANQYTQVEEFTFDAAEWLPNKCLYIVLGEQVTPLSYSDYPTMAALIGAVCDYFNNYAFADPIQETPYYQATHNGIDTVRLSLVNLLQLELVKFTIDDCNKVINHDCGDGIGVTNKVIQQMPDLNFAPHVFAYEPINPSNAVQYLSDLMASYISFNAGDLIDRPNIMDMVLICDPAYGVAVGQNVSKNGFDVLGKFTGIFDQQRNLDNLGLPMSVYAMEALSGTGLIIIAPKGCIQPISTTFDMSNGTGMISHDVKDRACETAFVKFELEFGMYIKNPGHIWVNFCGNPFINKTYRNVKVEKDNPEHQNCICPADCLGEVMNYNLSCSDLAQSLINSNAVNADYNSASNTLSLNYAAAIPNDLVAIEYSVWLDNGQTALQVTTGGSYDFVFPISLAGHTVSISVKVVTEACPEGYSRNITFIINEDGSIGQL